LAQQDTYQTSYIRQKIAKKEYGVSPHAIKKMGERKIWLDEALEAIINGEAIETQSFEDKNVRVLFQEATTDVPRFCIIVAIDHPDVQIVTAFNFKEEKFEYIEKQKCWRRIK